MSRSVISLQVSEVVVHCMHPARQNLLAARLQVMGLCWYNPTTFDFMQEPMKSLNWPWNF